MLREKSTGCLQGLFTLHYFVCSASFISTSVQKQFIALAHSTRNFYLRAPGKALGTSKKTSNVSAPSKTNTLIPGQGRQSEGHYSRKAVMLKAPNPIILSNVSQAIPRTPLAGTRRGQSFYRKSDYLIINTPLF